MTPLNIIWITIIIIITDESFTQSDFAAVGTNCRFVWPEENRPPTEPGFSQGFFSILSPMEFWFLAAVASGLLSLGHLAFILDFFYVFISVLALVILVLILFQLVAKATFLHYI